MKAPRTFWLIDVLALVVLVAYGWTVRYTGRGEADPVWTTIQERGVLRVGIDPGFRPFAEQVDGGFQGYDVQLATEVAQRLGLRVEFKQVVYDALYDVLAAHEVDLLAAALPLAPEQGWRARFTTAYLNAGQLLVVRPGSGIGTLGDLGGKRAGAASGSEGDMILRNLARQDATITIQTDHETSTAAFSALAAGHVDAVVAETVAALTAQAQYPRLQIARDALTFDPYVLAVPIEAYQLHREVNRVLDELRSEGYFDQLNKRWFRPAP